MADAVELLTQLTKDYKASLLLTKELVLELIPMCPHSHDSHLHVEQLMLVEEVLAKLEWVEVP